MVRLPSPNRRWNRPCFEEGEAVEVRLMSNGFRASWYEAHVIGHCPDRRSCTVVHDALLADDSDEPGPLKVVLLDDDVRPRPPLTPSEGGRFEPHQRVDALHNDGWWDGVVERVLGDEGEGSGRKYVVRFPMTKEELEFLASELRPHLDWVDGKWVVLKTLEGIRNCAAKNNRRKKNIPQRVGINIDTKASSEAIQLEQSDCKNAGNKEINQDYVIPVVVDGNNVSHEVQSSSHEVQSSSSQAEAATQGQQLEQSECKSAGNKETYPDLGISVIVDNNSNTREVQLHSTSQVETATQCDGCLMDHVDKILSNAMVNASLSMLNGASRASPSMLNGASTSPTQLNTGTEALNQSPSSASVVKGWPFEKESPMWESVESYEVISKMLQPPHFRALEQKYNKMIREGMAIGLMVSYNSLMNSKCDLKIDDPDCIFNDKERTLLELEENGFDVRSLWTQLDELWRIRVKHVQLSEDSSALKSRLIEKNKEENMMNSEMVEIDKTIVELKETLSRLRKRKRTVLEQKEDHDAEMDKLQLNAKLLEEDFQSLEHDFKRISDAAWLVVDRVPDLVDYWVTYNKPHVFCLLTYCAGAWLGGKPDMIETTTFALPTGVYQQAKHWMAVAHSRAYDYLHEEKSL